MYKNELADLVITEIIYCIAFSPLRILAILRTLNILKTLTERKADNAPFPFIIVNSTRLSMTIVPSRMLNVLSVYFLGPRANILIPNSAIKV